jgi:hypothetical protein
MQINGYHPDAATEASDSAAAIEGSLAAEQDDRRASHQQASASGRDELPPEDQAFKRFDRIIDDWLVRPLRPPFHCAALHACLHPPLDI